MLWLEGNQSARQALCSSFENVSERVFEAFQQRIYPKFSSTPFYHGLLYWLHVESLHSTTVLTVKKVSRVFGVFQLVHNSNFCSAFYPLWPWMIESPFQKMCPQHPSPRVAWSCDTNLIIKIGRKLKNLIKALHQSESQKCFQVFRL